MSAIDSCLKRAGVSLWQQATDHPKITVVSFCVLCTAAGGLAAMHSTALAMVAPALAAIALVALGMFCLLTDFRDAEDHALELLSPTTNDRDKGVIFQSFFQIKADERKGVIANVRRLIRPEMDGLEVGRLVHLLAELEISEREVFTSKVLRFPEEIRSIIIECFDTYSVFIGNEFEFFRLRVLSPEERMRKIKRVLVQFQVDIVRHPGLQKYSRLTELIQTPVNQRFPPAFGGMAAAAAVGNTAINVHANDRDQRTIDALALLRKAQGPIEKGGIAQAVQAFIAYLKTSESITDETKRLALKALQGAPSKVDFGPLLGDPHCISYQISGDEAVARHWLYATHYKDPKGDAQSLKEQNNAKLGMITALSTSYTENEERVCNEGKVQRLVVHVLQGRLKGVDIDQIPTLIPTAAALEMFFNVKQRRDISNRSKLLKAAEAYCKENPAVERIGFLADIQEYANQAEMP